MNDDEKKALLGWAREFSGPGSAGVNELADALEAAQETIAAFIIGGAAHPADDVYQTSIAHPAEERAWEYRRVDPRGFVHFTFPAPEHRKIVVDGEIEVCAGCKNSLGYNVGWALAHPVVTEEMVERAAEATWNAAPGDEYPWTEMVAEDPKRADIFRAEARAALSAALNPEGES